MSPQLATTRVEDWKYTAEGGANLVLSYTGECPDYIGKVLRLRKVKRDGKDEAGQADLEFSKEIIEPLLGKDQVVEMEQVELDRSWLQRVAESVGERGTRPREREAEGGIDVDAKFGFIAQDLVGRPGTLTFEIKPKWGFLPLPVYLSPSTRWIKTTFCRFCMHRYLKTSSLYEHASGYCPLDLYSDDPDRKRRGLEKLVAGWKSSKGEGNNFRVFVDGERVVPNDRETISKLEASLKPYMSNDMETDNDRLESLVSSLLEPVLSSNPLLSTLSRLQSTFDVFDIQGLHDVAIDRSDVDLSNPQADLWILDPEPTLEDWKKVVASLDPRADPSLGCPQPDLNYFRIRQVALSNLLSATFKDCSILVSFSLDNPSTPTVKAIDLDPKPMPRVGHYYRLDKEIVDNWKNLIVVLTEEEKKSLRRCRDDGSPFPTSFVDPEPMAFSVSPEAFSQMRRERQDCTIC